MHLPAERPGEDDAGATTRPAEPTTRPAPRPSVQQPQEPAVSPEVLAKLQAAAPADPAQAARLADTLFADGHLAPAYVVYQAALDRETSESRAAWLVFQMANCKKLSDPELAGTLYRQLIAQYPKSRWAGPAKIQEKILQWQRVNEPQGALAQARGAMQQQRE
jgi:hypothetical protein